MTFWCLRASAAFFWLAYFSLPRSRIFRHRRICVGRYLHEVEAGFLGGEQRFVDGDFAAVAAVGIDELNPGHPDITVGARPLFGGRRCLERSANGSRLLELLTFRGYVVTPMSCRHWASQ